MEDESRSQPFTAKQPCIRPDLDVFLNRFSVIKSCASSNTSLIKRLVVAEGPLVR